MVIGRKRNQKAKRITIAALGIAGEVAFHDEILKEEPTDPAAQRHAVMRLHEALPEWRTSRTEGQPPSSTRTSYTSTVAFPSRCSGPGTWRDAAGAAGRFCLGGTS